MDALQRTLMGLRCRDCDRIPKVQDAGRIRIEEGTEVQVMHNGVRVVSGGYHGDWMAHLIRGLRGHHEPQEESLFYEVVRFARHGSLFVELGSFWAYYSIWYLTEVPSSTAICIEPDAANIEVGRRNAALNGMVGRMRFIDGAASATSGPIKISGETTGQTRTVPGYDIRGLIDLAAERQIEVLHVDVQGAETDLLRSLPKDCDQHIRFVVVSTHHHSISGSHSTHKDCLAAIRARGGHVLSSHSVQESFSGDGLILASFSAADRGLRLPRISKNAPKRSLFPSP